MLRNFEFSFHGVTFVGYLLEKSADDTKSLRFVSKIYSYLLCHHGVDRNEFNMRWKSAGSVKRVLCDKVSGFIAPFWSFPFYLLKTQRNRCFCGVLWDYKMRKMARNVLIYWLLHSSLQSQKWVEFISGNAFFHFFSQLHGNKRHIRAILVERVRLQHDMRVLDRQSIHFTEMDRLLVDDLLLLATTDYAEVRSWMTSNTEQPTFGSISFHQLIKILEF